MMEELVNHRWASVQGEDRLGSQEDHPAGDVRKNSETGHREAAEQISDFASKFLA
jgi:hypothetical protein